MGKPTVYMWPKFSPDNKYSELLTRSVEDNGLHVEHYDKRNALKPAKGDIVHMHWPSYSYQASSFPLTIVKSLLYAALLLFFKLRGVRLFWTVHNIWPHSTGKTKWDYLMRKYILAVCNKGFVLSESVKREAVETFGVSPDKLVVTPHGHYVDAYPAGGADIRKRFGIPSDHFLFLFVGRINPYKGIERLVEAFTALKLDSAHLLIAGKVDDGYSLDFIDKANDPRIKVYPKFVDDSELVDYLRAGNVVVLPYNQITTSGSAILALSYYKPVVAPKLGSLSEYIPEGGGILYDPADPEGLRKALEQSVRLNREETEKHIAKKLAELDWKKIAGRMIHVYMANRNDSRCS
ncbi:glycosyltransferase family 4 protein [Paenibacillus thailandensis]|uniref:glycosyltransferase family 4 protein n=1 Tax=Paenibacillus thailandensis TaxID=393250 RepID=UPI0036379941